MLAATIDSGVLVAFGGFALMAFMFYIDHKKPDPPPPSSHLWDYKIETKREEPEDG